MASLRQVFISHETKHDGQVAHRIAQDLERMSVLVWIAPESIRPGESWVEAIDRGLGESSHMVIVLTPAAVRSSWVDKEIEAGVMLERKKRIELIPLDVEPCDVSILLSTYQMVSFRQNYDTALRQLTGILGSITPAPQQKLTCSLCGLPFNRETDLLAHISNWHSFVCPKCGLGFNRQSDMDTHMKNWHSGKR